MKYKILLLFLGFSITALAQKPEYSVLLLDSKLKVNANAILREHQISVDVSMIDKMKYNEHKVVTVLNESGNRKVRSHAFYSKGITVNKLEMYVYDSFGKEIEHYRKRDFKDVSQADGFSLYNDDRILYIDYIPKVYPYTAVFTSEITSSNSAFIPRWSPVEGYNSSTENSTYTINFASSNKPSVKLEHLDGYDITIEETPEKFIAVAKNIPAIRYEEQAPSFIDFAPSIVFALKNFSLQGVIGSAESWGKYGEWMNKTLLEGTNDLSPQTIAEIQLLVANEKSNLDKARKIYQYLQDKVRYISVQIGIGGWKPMKASEVDNLSYGDCKALSNYTKSLLDAVGVPSYYTILYSSKNERDISEDFVHMQGNHAILGIPDNGEIVWLECTSQEVPFGYMGNGNDDRDVLIITDKGGEIVHTKKYTAQENHQMIEATIQLKEDGKIEASVIRVSKGLQYGSKFRRSKLQQDELIDELKEDWSYINGLEVKNILVENDKKNIVFTEKTSVEASNYLTKVGENLIFCVNAFNQWEYVPPRIENRKREVKISMSFIDEDEYTIVIPDGYRVESLPASEILQNDFGSYEISFEQENDKIIYKRKVVKNKGIYSVDSYNEYRSFLKKMTKLDKTKILLEKKS